MTESAKLGQFSKSLKRMDEHCGWTEGRTNIAIWECKFTFCVGMHLFPKKMLNLVSFCIIEFGLVNFKPQRSDFPMVLNWFVIIFWRDDFVLVFCEYVDNSTNLKLIKDHSVERLQYKYSCILGGIVA